MPKWSKEQLELAVAKVKAKQLSMRKAAETYGVPVSTLHSHVHSIPEKVGAVLTRQEEKEIVYTCQVIALWLFFNKIAGIFKK